jgi:hypothetical protein
LPRTLVDLYYVFDAPRRPLRAFLEAALDQIGDPQEGKPAFQEGLHGHLIGGVEHRRGGAARPQGLARQPERREAPVVGRFERQRRHLGEVEPRYRRLDPLRPAKGIGDGRAHVGVAELRQN